MNQPVELTTRRPSAAFVVCFAVVGLFFLSLSGEWSKPGKGATNDLLEYDIEDAGVPTSVAWGAKGQWIATGITRFINSGELRIVDLKAGRVVSTVRFSEPFAVAIATAVSPDQRFVAASALAMDGSGEWFVFDRRTGRISRQFPRRRRSVFGLEFNQDGSLLAIAETGRDDHYVRIRRVGDGRTVAEFKLSTPHHVVQPLGFSPKGNLLAFAYHNPDPDAAETGALVVWDWQNGRVRHTTTGFNNPVSRLAFSPDGKFLVTAGGPAWRPREPTARSEIVVWRPDGTKVAELSGLRGQVTSLRFSKDGRRLAAAAYDLSNPLTIKVWENRITDWKATTTLVAKSRTAPNALLFSGNNTLLSASVDGWVRKWDLRHARQTDKTAFWND